MRIKKSGGIEINGNVEISGAVSIGTNTTQPGYQLLVDNGKAGFREVFVKLTGQWPDYVFDSDYKLQPPSEIEKFYRKNKRLQNMPSAKDIETDGQNVGDIQRLQQEHLEVSYLYIIELYKTVAELKTEIDDLKNDIAKLKSRQ